MVVAIDEKADRLIQRDKLDELMRIDAGFRKSSAAYCILVSVLMVKDDIDDDDRRVLLNLQADMIYKAEILMEVSPSLRARAQRHLRLLRKEVTQ
jgi:hypothetical protein